MNERDDDIDRLFNSRFKKEKKDPPPLPANPKNKTKNKKLDVTNAEQKEKAILHFYGHVNLLFVSPSLGKKKEEEKKASHSR